VSEGSNTRDGSREMGAERRLHSTAKLTARSVRFARASLKMRLALFCSAQKLALETREKLNEELRAAAEQELKKLRDAELLKAELLKKQHEDLTHKHDGDVTDLKSSHSSVMSTLEGNLDATKIELLQTSGEKDSLTREVIELKAAIEEMRILNEQKVTGLVEGHKEEKSKLKSEFKSMLKFQESEAENTLEMVKSEFAEEKAEMEISIAEKNSELEAMHERWLARESRPEDLDTIRGLEMEMVEKDALVKKTKEEMIYFKRELLNREENFNKKFNTNVNVGVMSVIKPKDGNGNGNVKGRRRSSVGGLPPAPPGGGPQFGF